MWKWSKGEATSPTELGNPTSSSTYALCIYDRSAGRPTLKLSALLPPGGTCAGQPCWNATGKGFKYADSDAAAAGIKSILLNSGSIAKKELQRNPLFGPVFAAGGTIFVDRFNHAQAVRALEPAIDALRRGISIVIAPEGTRSPTPRLGRFKKGAFHLALAAKRPIVPVVFRNTLDVLPKRGIILRPATVEVVVHKPIPTAGWKRRDLDRHIGEVHRLFEQTLAA